MRAARAVVLAALVGCGWLDAGTPAPERGDEERPRERTRRKPRKEAQGPVTAQGNGAPRTVLFVVLDTVRADHTSLCGYERPTTPTLQAMVARGAVHACRAYSPAPWTHPSHASFFTGRPVTEHGAIWVTDSDVALNPVTRVRPLHDDFTTLAERFRDRGYQTVAVTANMIVTPPSGLLQGFDTVHVTPSSLGLRGRKLRRLLDDVVADLDPSRPLFLFVNVYDAHDPYPAIPDGVGWVPPQARLDLHPNQHDERLPYYRYVKGLVSEADAAGFLREVRDGYDWGIHEADANLGHLLERLASAGWLGDDFRVAVTSDHGELLGEHRLLRHGGYLHEGMVNVPLVYYDATAASQPALPEPVAAVVVHDLLLEGRLPDLPVEAVSERNERDVLVGQVGAALWRGDEKVRCADGARSRVDLRADPGEHRPEALRQDHPLAAPLDDACARVDRLIALPPPKADDDAYRKALELVGYLEPDPGPAPPQGEGGAGRPR